MKNIEKILKNISSSPGVYQFLNSAGNIIYIGKSINLKNRVNSYFNSKTKLNFAKIKLVKQIADIKTILTNNETESLILETTLIKKHLPKYNILMKDGKNHIYIKITDETVPRVIKTRFKNGNGEYFGPYTSTNYVNNILKVIKKLFGYITCNIVFENNDGEIKIKSNGNTKFPCIDFYTGTCSGPCKLGKDNIGEYLNRIEEIKLFLKGNINDIVKNLEIKMLKKAKNLEFEQAEILKKYIESINSLKINQIVREGIIGDYSVINYIEKFDNFYIGLIEIKDSKITGFYNFEIKNNLKEEKEEIIKEFIERKFVEIENENIKNKQKNKNIFIIPFNLNQKINNNINIEVAKIGAKKELLDLCYKNIYEYAYKSHIESLSTKGFTKQTMINILDLLGYEKINKSIIFECNDISHISGNYTVASRSIIENGKSNTSKYKKFKIKTLEDQKIDDFGSMKEIITRRLKEIEKTNFIPDLIIIDGGKGQLNSVLKIINNEKNNSDNLDYKNLIEKLQIVSIAKKQEELFVKGLDNAIILSKDSQELKLIQKIRDEAHRFAITFNRDSRIKAMKKNILESLPGFGVKTRTKLLKKYGNIDNLKNVSNEELLKIINKNQLETLENHGII